jgi:hypothetical protein
VNDGIAVEMIYRGHEAILEFLLGRYAEVAQDGAGEFGKEALDEIEPEPCLGVKVNSNRCAGWPALEICAE